MADKEGDRDEGATTADDVVITKYRMAGDIVNATLKAVMEMCKAGEPVLKICDAGDKMLLEQTAKVYRKEKEVKKGIAFPTCISVNNCICHFSPLLSDPEVLLKDGDLVKIDLGAHVDGFAAVVAHTIVVGASSENKITGRKADVIMAAHLASEAALRLVKGGNENYMVTDAIQKVAESFKCKPIEGMLSHELKQHVIDGEKAIIQNPNEAQRKEHERCEFKLHEVYGVDMLITTGEGKGREHETRTSVYKKKDIVYQLKRKTSRQFFSDVEKRFHLMPFTLRLLPDETKARMGVLECVKHELVQPFNVLYEREGELVAQFKFTVLLLPNGPLKITGLPVDTSIIESQYSVEDEELKTLLATSASRKTHKKKKKKAGKAMAENAEGVAAPEEEVAA
ncbi:proliferation-associated protein 2G4-like [Liolophura sinensis]|uniref:proliferation-associated protein 2G4-like n=1 Tax=Liolophura sinensis TaxID=3198878 RepID=UPI0031599279